MSLDGARRDHPGRDPRAPEVGAAGTRNGADHDHARPPGRVLGGRPRLRLLRRVASSRSATPTPSSASPAPPVLARASSSPDRRPVRRAGTSRSRRLGPRSRRHGRPVHVRGSRLPVDGPECVATRPPLVEVEPDRSSACPANRRNPRRVDVVRATRCAPSPSPPRRSSEPTPLVVVSELPRSSRMRPSRALGRTSRSRSERARRSASVGDPVREEATLGRCLVGLEDSDGQRARRTTLGGVDASDYARLSREDRGRLRRSVQIVFQDPYSTLRPDPDGRGRAQRGTLLVDGFRATAPTPARGRAARARRPALGYARRRPAALSGGERQRAGDPPQRLGGGAELIVCDEPVSALDVSVQAQILRPLPRAARGVRARVPFHHVTTLRSSDRSSTACTSSTAGSSSRKAPVDRGARPPGAPVHGAPHRVHPSVGGLTMRHAEDLGVGPRRTSSTRPRARRVHDRRAVRPGDGHGSGTRWSGPQLDLDLRYRRHGAALWPRCVRAQGR